MQYFGISLLVVSLVFPLCSGQQTNKTENQSMSIDLQTVSAVDISRYVGIWYEIAKIPNSFQKKCVSGTTATYSIREDGRISVLNRCITKDGSMIEANGVARIVDTMTNAKLEVSFVRFLGLQLFWGDYWIIGLDKNYNYAVVGNPSRKYGWILSRTPVLLKEDEAAIFEILRSQGYNPASFEFTKQKK